MYICYYRWLSDAQKDYNNSNILTLTEKEYEWMIYYGIEFDSIILVQEPSDV